MLFSSVLKKRKEVSQICCLISGEERLQSGSVVMLEQLKLPRESELEVYQLHVGYILLFNLHKLHK